MAAVFFYIWGETSNKYQGFRQVGEEKVKFRGISGDKFAENRPIQREFRGSFWGKPKQKAIVKKGPILWLFSWQISLEIDQFWADQTSIFNVFLTEVIICSFNNTLLKCTNGKAFNIMASAQFFATYLRLVVWGRCLHVPVTNSKINLQVYGK